METKHKIAIVAIVVPVVTALCIECRKECQDRENQQLELQRQQEAARPRLEYVSVRYEDGYTVLTFQNKSPVTTIAVTHLDFIVSDNAAIATIERLAPRPRTVLAEWPNNIDDVGFTKGHWAANNSYCFPKDVGYHIPPGEVGDFRLAIINPLWAGAKFLGNLEVRFSSGTPSNVMETYRLRDVTIQGRPTP